MTEPERNRQAFVALALAVGLLTGCAVGDESARMTPSEQAIPFNLYTHCGIDEARIGSTYFEAETPLSDGQGNPPEGWDNPHQRGAMTLKSEKEAVFTDDAGHEVKFRARPGASGFKRICS